MKYFLQSNISFRMFFQRDGKKVKIGAKVNEDDGCTGVGLSARSKPFPTHGSTQPRYTCKVDEKIFHMPSLRNTTIMTFVNQSTIVKILQSLVVEYWILKLYIRVRLGYTDTNNLIVNRFSASSFLFSCMYSTRN